MVTIKDVAARARVSTATVSAAINNTAYVSPELRARVSAAVESLGYTPSAMARGLKKGSTRLIGLVVADASNPFFTELIHAVEAATNERSYALMLCNSDENFDKERVHLTRVRAQGCAGLILTPTGDPKAYRASDEGSPQIPTVLVDRAIDGWPVDSITLDNLSAAVQATSYVLDLGHRRIATITGPQHVSTGVERLSGFLQALAGHGVSPDPELIRSGDFREDVAFSATQELLRRSEPPTAIYVANNVMLIGVMRAIADAGLSCPTDISVVATDDFSWANAFRPRLTTVRQPVREMASEAVRLLVERLSRSPDGAPKRLVLPPNLIVRESCAPLRG